MARILTLFIPIIILSACTDLKNDANRTIIARAGDKYLYADELPRMINSGISEADSISITRNFIDRWIKKELMLSRAELNLTDEYISEMNQKLEETRSSLMIYQYQQQMMVQRMDTTVDVSEIDSYYNDNIQAFNLTHPLVKAVFIKIPLEAPNINRARSWYRSNSQEDLQNLESYCYQFADKYDDFGEKWIDVSYLLRVLPSDVGDIGRFLRNNNYYEVSDSLYYYFVNIRDFRLTGAVAPLEYVSKDIRNIILNNRKIEFLQNLENGIYNEALRENLFKIY
jgi:hypothetical protein